MANDLGTEVCFDLTRGDGWVQDGSEELVTHCLAALGIERAPAGWQVSRFCSPYYGVLPDAEAYQDYCRTAWRFKVSLNEGPRLPAFFPSGSVLVDVPDSSWRYKRGYAAWTECDCVVIGNFVFRSVEYVRGRLGTVTLGAGRATADVYDGGAKLTHVRVNLGIRKFPEARPEVEQVVRAVHELGGVTHHSGLL